MAENVLARNVVHFLAQKIGLQIQARLKACFNILRAWIYASFALAQNLQVLSQALNIIRNKK